MEIHTESCGVCPSPASGPGTVLLVGQSPVMRELWAAIRKVGAVKTTVLVEGESGTGKELVARAIHESSPWKDKPFVSVHCAALSPTLLESELFGHERGAFTGAQQLSVGRFERAQGGTLFLDEVAEIPLEVQVKLLRVLQEREFERVGGSETRKLDLRVVAATNRSLEQRVSQGAFREDLFYRLNVLTLRTPPLRDHLEDIPLLSENLLERICRRLGCPRRRLSPDSIKAFQRYAWPGNVRELQNVLEKGLVLSEKETLEIVPPSDREFRPSPGERVKGLSETLEEVERTLIARALRDSKGVLSRAARQLDVSRSALQYKVAKYGLSYPVDGSPARN